MDLLPINFNISFCFVFLSVVHCKHGCGNGVHVRCMAVVVKHQLDAVELEENTKLEDHILTCPMCR